MLEMFWNGNLLDIDVSNVMMMDRVSGEADSLDILLPASQPLWDSWENIEGSKIKINKDGYSTGTMYFDFKEAEGNYLKVSAVSFPSTARSSYSKSWINVGLNSFISELSNKAKLDSVMFYDTQDYPYSSLQMVNEGLIGRIAKMALNEGYVLKINDSKALIINEKVYENKLAVKTIYASQFQGNAKFEHDSNSLIASIYLGYLSTDSTRITKKIELPLNGRDIIISEHVDSEAHAERLLKSILRQANKYKDTVTFNIALDVSVAAGVVIDLQGNDETSNDGDWYVYQVNHSLVKERTRIFARRKIGGDY